MKLLSFFHFLELQMGKITRRLDKLLSAAWQYKKPLAIGIDTVLVLLSLCFAYMIRLGINEAIETRYFYQILLIAMIIVPVKVMVFWIFRLYHISFRYISLEEVLAMVKATAFFKFLVLVMFFPPIHIYNGDIVYK